MACTSNSLCGYFPYKVVVVYRLHYRYFKGRGQNILHVSISLMLLCILLLFQNFHIIINCCVFELFHDEFKVKKCCTKTTAQRRCLC